ncbi:MAG: TIGR01906 family membrane protein [Candidatus Paralactobacillus gallistercoris]|uniref:TIGR01906 family membrane protein n=1 Tax=Candidatus Paralactobacillus gallistercoris TaxID=2838724 RepID=A0A948TJI9_9LACO|nr:TIGR01906 family membrane protein [Candidatus Paralactobacillus gallistercoris]
MNLLKYRLQQSWLWLCTVIFVISSSVCLTFIGSLLLYPFDISYLHLLNIVQIDPTTLLHNYHQLLAYLFCPWLTHLQMTNFPSSLQGLAHFASVKQLLLINNIALIITGCFTDYFWHYLRQRHQLWRLLYPAEGLLMILVTIMFLMMSNFDRFFVIFHKLLFHNQDWLFDPNTDPIINVLPTQFFEQCFIVFGVLMLLWIVVGILIGKRCLRNKK